MFSFLICEKCQIDSPAEQLIYPQAAAAFQYVLYLLYILLKLSQLWPECSISARWTPFLYWKSLMF